MGDGTDAAASWASNVTRAALVKEYFESRAIETTIGVAALPVGIALALAGRKHHQKLTLALVAGFGVWLGLMAIDLLRDLVPNVLGDSVTIPDNDYVNYGSAAVVALILMRLAANVYKLFGVVVGLMCAVGISSVTNHIVDDVPISATIVINVVGALGGLYLVTPFLTDKLGILFSFVGGALVAVGASFAIFVAGGVTECADTASAACNWAVPLAAGGSAKVVAKYVPDIWVLAVGTKVNAAASAGAHSFDFSNYSNYIAIGVALLFVYMGICTQGRAGKGETSETSPLLGDAEKGEVKSVSAPSFFKKQTTTSGERVNEARTKRRRRVHRVQFCKSYHSQSAMVVPRHKLMNFRLAKRLDQMRLVERHELRDERFQVHDGFGSALHANIEVGGPKHDLMLNFDVNATHQSLGEVLQDDFGRNAVDDEFVQTSSHLQQPRRRLLG